MVLPRPRAPLLFLGLVAACGRGERPPDVVLITVDTLRADHLSCYGYERDTSPFLRELGEHGLVFEAAVSQCGTTPQSLSSLMTGLYPFTDGILARNGRFAFLRGENRTLAAELSEAGYQTHAITSQIQAARVTGLDLGFQSFDGVELGPDAKQEPNRRADEMTDRALAWLREERDPERPFFLWLHYLDPHHPYHAPDAYAGDWRDEEPSEEGSVREYRYDPKGSLAWPVSDGELARLVLDYDREIRFTDDQLRRLFEEGLDDIEEPSLVVFSADHGEALGDFGMIGHNDLFEPILHVPLIVCLPGEGAPRGRVETPVMLVDLHPTILEVAGVPLGHAVRGRSLLPLVRGSEGIGAEPGPPRLRYAEYPGHQALYASGYKLLRRQRKDGQSVTALFALGPDGEGRDLSDAHPELVESMGRAIDELRAAPLAPAGGPGGPGEMPEVTPEMIRELEALGYGEATGG